MGFKNIKNLYPGNPKSEEKTVYKNEHGLGRSASFDFLTKLPGVGNLENAKKIAARIVNIQELMNVSKKELYKILGNNVLWEFLHPNCTGENEEYLDTEDLENCELEPSDIEINKSKINISSKSCVISAESSNKNIEKDTEQNTVEQNNEIENPIESDNLSNLSDLSF